MTWPIHYKVRVQSYLTALKELNQVATEHEYKQLFRSSPKNLKLQSVKNLIALKRAADDTRKIPDLPIPPSALAMLTLMKERDRV